MDRDDRKRNKNMWVKLLHSSNYADLGLDEQKKKKEKKKIFILV